MKEYDIFVPLHDNDGSKLEPDIFIELQKTLLDEFDGCTYFPQVNEGYWRMGDVTYRDEIVIYRAVARNVRRARRFIASVKARLKTQLQQDEIFIIERDVELR